MGRISKFRYGAILFALIGITAPGIAQEVGAIETFGPEGRVYSLDKNEHFLLSRQSYHTEDSTGYMGQIRFVLKYEGGGYQIQTRQYVARCRVFSGDQNQVVTYEPGREAETTSTATIRPAGIPAPDMKNAYNLFWAACYHQFRKFR